MEVVSFSGAEPGSGVGSRISNWVRRLFLIQPNHRFLFRLKLLALVLVVVGSRWAIAKDFGSPVPYWDQWYAEAHNLYLPWLEHRLDPQALFAAHNEHRVAVTRLYSLGLLELNGRWDPRLQMAVNALIAAGVPLFLGIVLCRIFGARRENIILLTLALLWSLPFGYASTTAGFHSQWYFFILFALVSLWGLLLKPNFTLGWWLGALATMLGIFSMVSGFVAGLVVCAIKVWQMFVDPKARWSHLPSLLVGATAAVGLLLVHTPEQHQQFRADSVGAYLQALGRNLGWPWSETPWCAFILFLPVALCAYSMIRNRQKPTSAHLVVAGLAAWAIAQALGAAYARATNPVASRHMDALTVGVMANLLALMLLADQQGPAFCRGRRLQFVALAWAFVVIAGLGRQTATALDKGLIPLASHNHNFEVHCQQFLGGQPDAHFQRGDEIPCPDPVLLESLLLNPTLQTIYPPCLQLPQPLRQIGAPSSAFVENGVHAGTNEYLGQSCIGSYNCDGNAAVGSFRSEVIQPKNAVLLVPVAGYPRAEGMSIKLVIESSQREIPIKLRRDPGDGWKAVKILSPGEPFRIVADDRNPNSWIAIAAPRNLGWLSVVNEALLATGHQLMFLGVLLFTALSPLPKWIWNQISGPSESGAASPHVGQVSERGAAA